MVFEFVEWYGEYAEEQDDKESKKNMFFVLRELHGRGCQIYLEILCLLKNEFADGAYARWRSLYEINIVAQFISKEGEIVAKEFLDYHAYLDYKDGKIDKPGNEIINKFKHENINSYHIWAKTATCFSGKKTPIRFSDLEKECNIVPSIWRESFSKSSQIVHASPQGTFGRISNKGTNKIPFIAVGASNYGLEIPADHTVISFYQLTMQYINIFPSYNSMYFSYIMDKWVKRIREEFYKVKNDVLDNDSEALIGRLL